MRAAGSGRASTATSSKPIACSRPTAAGSRASTEAVRSGLTAEAAVQKVRDETKSRMMQVTDPYLRERLYDLEDLANRLQQYPDRAGPGGQRRRAARRVHPGRRRRWGRPSCWTTRIAASRGWCSRKARRPAMSRSSRARSTFRSSAGSPEATRADRAGRHRRRRRRPRHRADPAARRHPADRSTAAIAARTRAPRLLRDAARHRRR